MDLFVNSIWFKCFIANLLLHSVVLFFLVAPPSFMIVLIETNNFISFFLPQN